MNTSENRNLAEQVLKNKKDILKHFQRDEILADFGIRIIGQLANTDELYALPTEGLEYGDSYAVGTKSPFNYYIWTRANNLSPVDYWFDFGQIAIAGPAGPRGFTGPAGKQGESSRWFDYVWVQNAPDAAYHDGDMALSKDGTVYMYEQGQWSFVTNIKGPTGATGATGPRGAQGEPGPQGPKGNTGDVGGFVNIAGIIADEYSLPDPELISNLTVAYLVGVAEPYNLYIQVGSTSATAQWLNAGPLNVATLVTVGGQYQNTWDADTKLDKATKPSIFHEAYVKFKNGTSGFWLIADSTKPTAGALAQYGQQGQIYSNPPTNDAHCATKKYVDDLIAELSSRIQTLEQAHAATFTVYAWWNDLGTDSVRTFEFTEGMTWEQWINTSYNVAGITNGDSEGGNIGRVYYDITQLTLDYLPVSIDNLIRKDGDYRAF